MQARKSAHVYKNTLDAFKTIYAQEGIPGLKTRGNPFAALMTCN